MGPAFHLTGKLISDHDYGIPESRTLTPNFRINALGFRPDQESSANHYRNVLATLLGTHMRGHYHLRELPHGSDCALELTFLEEDDRNTFVSHYPDWDEYERAAQDNLGTLREWREVGRMLQDNRLYDYILK